jgi:hypothetical protein
VGEAGPATIKPLLFIELLDHTFRLYRENILQFIGILTVMQIPLQLASRVPVRRPEGAESIVPDDSFRRLTAADRALIADFLQRRNKLANRKELAGILLEAMCRRPGRIPREADRADSETVLEMLAREEADSRTS